MTRVCFFGAYDPGYPRNRLLIDGLRKCGVLVVEARAAERRAVLRYPALVLAFARVARAAQVLLVPAFRHKDVPLASGLKGRRLLVFDPLVSRYDTLVGDWAIHEEGSAQARWNRAIDRWALSRADRVLCDTWAHGALFERLGVERRRLRRVLVGAEDQFFRAADPPAEPLRVVYLGGFLPLHGITTVLEAAALLEREAPRLPEFRVDLVGRGIDFERARTLAARLSLGRVGFPGPSPYLEAPRVLSRATIVLGAFGAGEKAGRVIPHKVYQGLACGRAVVTGDGSGLREVFEPGRHLVAVPRGDAAALAQALADLIGCPERRAALAKSGRERMLEIGTAERIGRTLVEAIEGEAEGKR